MLAFVEKEVLKLYIWIRFCRDGGIGRRTGLKILWEVSPVPVRLRLSVQQKQVVTPQKRNNFVFVFI